MTNETKLILQKLEKIEKDVVDIKEHMVDSDAILDEEDRQAIEQAENEFKEGKTTFLEQLKKKIDL